MQTEMFVIAAAKKAQKQVIKPRRAVVSEWDQRTLEFDAPIRRNPEIEFMETHAGIGLYKVKSSGVWLAGHSDKPYASRAKARRAALRMARGKAPLPVDPWKPTLPKAKKHWQPRILLDRI
jgi:hypothetical protein